MLRKIAVLEFVVHFFRQHVFQLAPDRCRANIDNRRYRGERPVRVFRYDSGQSILRVGKRLFPRHNVDFQKSPRNSDFKIFKKARNVDGQNTAVKSKEWRRGRECRQKDRCRFGPLRSDIASCKI